MTCSPLNSLSILPHFQASGFSNLSPDLVARLNMLGHVRQLGPNDFVYLQEDEATSFYFVQSGHIKLSYLLEDGTAILFSVLPPGESFGELGIFDGEGHAEMATSIGESTIISIPRSALHGLAEQSAELDLALGKTIARRYRSYISLSRILGLKTLAGRLSQSLVRLADILGEHVPYHGREVLQIGPFVTQTDLGLMARGARGNVNRTLKMWEAEGWIAMEHRRILILDRTSLENAAFAEEF